MARVSPLAAVLALGWCAFVLLAHLAGGWLSCSGDTSDCASTTARAMVYQGQLPYANTPFAITGPGAGYVGGFRTDSHGRYCIVWTPDGGSFIVQGQETAGYFLGSTGHVLQGRSPSGCQYGDGGVSWDRSEGLTSSPQYWSVITLGLVTMCVLILGLALGKADSGGRVRAAGVALSIASTVLPLVLWWSQL